MFAPCSLLFSSRNVSKSYLYNFEKQSFFCIYILWKSRKFAYPRVPCTFDDLQRLPLLGHLTSSSSEMIRYIILENFRMLFDWNFSDVQV
jgi:hypothetical protein